jgi:hypothetical protein
MGLGNLIKWSREEIKKFEATPESLEAMSAPWSPQD